VLYWLYWLYWFFFARGCGSRFFWVLNRVTNRVDGIGTTAYTCDVAGQPLGEAGPWSAAGVNTTYSSRLRRSMSVQAPGAAAWTNGYIFPAAINVTILRSRGAGCEVHPW